MAHISKSHIDLLIIGAGPAGLMIAAWASRLNVSARIIDKRASRVPNGHADGIQPRTLEIFDSFGFADRPLKEAFHEIEICSWNPDSNGTLQRTQRVVSQKPGISRFQQVVLNQGAIEQTVLDFLRIGESVEVERNVIPEKLEWKKCNPSDRDSYPITVTVRHTGNATSRQPSKCTNANKINLDSDQSTASKIARTGQDKAVVGLEKIQAKYVVGCDGAHSWTRTQLGLSLEGEQTDYIWGVMDIVPLTDFPDIRQSCAIHSASSGSIMSVPREGRLVRFYIQMTDMSKSGIPDRSRISPESMLKAAQTIMRPYTLHFKYCEWWSVYQIGQRVAPKFSVDERLFLAGDAVHTHSPKLGQGLNVSMQDTYNLGWKICGVINGTIKPDILKTYHTERHQIALDLIGVDHEISQFYSNDRMYRKDFQSHRERFYEFLSGVSVKYGPNAIVGMSNVRSRSLSSSSSTTCTLTTFPTTDSVCEPDTPTPPRNIATNIHLGARIPSFKVISQSDARPTHIASLLPSTGQWRILLFAGDLTIPSQFARIQALGSHLVAPSSFLHFYPANLIEIYTIHSSPRPKVELLDLHEVFHPWDEDGGWDYWKVYADDDSWHEGFADAYREYGIDREDGCLVVCRPDQHVGLVCSVDDLGIVERYFGGILVQRSDTGGSPEQHLTDQEATYTELVHG